MLTANSADVRIDRAERWSLNVEDSTTRRVLTVSALIPDFVYVETKGTINDTK